MKRNLLSIIILLLAASANAAAPLTLDSCLSAVIGGNIDLAAEKLNLSIAEAEAVAARVFNDPTLGLEYANNDDHRMQMGQSVSVELGYTFSPGRRGAAIDLARSEKQLARALFDDYACRLKCDATVAYFEALKEKRLYELALSASESMEAIARGDSISLAVGEIRQVDAIATRIEARKAHADTRAAYAAYHDAMLSLALLMGNPALADAIDPVTEAMAAPLPDVSDNNLVDMAIERRADLRAAMGDVDVAAKALTVARRERNVEFDVSLGYNYNTEVRNEIAPAPKFSGMTVGVSIPLKFSNTNRGSISAAQYRLEQAKLQYDKACLEVESEVRSCLLAYRIAVEQLAAIDASTIAEARSIYDSYLDAYTHGDVSLVDLLQMRRNYEDIQMLRIEAQCATSTALARLLCALGL